ncbi:MAG: putative nuclease of restriction endonuclease-like RecB superfamily [Verrucomicrobiales bacterium]
MLTKDLIKFSLKGTQVKPDFIDPANVALLQLAENLLSIFRNAVGKTRSQLEEESKLIVEAAQTSGILGRGLEKLLFDRVDFETATDEDLVAWRNNLFLTTSKLLSEETFPSLEAYHLAIAEKQNKPALEIASQLFSDLPENQPVTRFRSFSAERLLHRYNAALVQWLLLQANALTITTKQQDTKAWRQFFRHLRFHQLLADISKNKSGTFKITVDGPMSLFQQTKKYGLSLASFFPAILHLAEWKLTAEIHLRKRTPKRLVLDHTCGIRPYSGHFLSHIPEEITLFQTLFHQQETAWELSAADDFVILPGDAYGFPDFIFNHPSGQRVALELFHPWHGGPLTHRLGQLDSLDEVPLLIGVDRKLAKDSAVAHSLENSQYFQHWGFTFRDMPSPKSVIDRLDALPQ